jgi:hypothetical protein
VGGAAPTVGAAGGWALGGGHSPLAKQFGLGADSTSLPKLLSNAECTHTPLDAVEFEIVTPDGELRTVNAYRNKDLFWALRGGGPGFGVSCISF